MSKRSKVVVQDVTGRWKPGANLRNRCAAEEAAKELTRIRKEYGRLTASAIVDAATDDACCLHPMFEWDDTAAADAFRHRQARDIVAALHIETKAGAGRMYVAVSVEEEDEREYVPVHHAMKVPDWREEVLEDSLRDLRAFRARYQFFKEMEEIVRAVDRILVRFEKRGNGRASKKKRARA